MDIIGDVQEAPEEVNESNNNLTGLAAVFHALKSKAKKNDGSSQRKETAYLRRIWRERELCCNGQILRLATWTTRSSWLYVKLRGSI